MKINKKHYSFKAEVPYFPHFMVDVRDGNEKLISAKMNNDNKTVQVSYSFNSKSCKAMYLHALNNDQRQQLEQMVLAGTKELMQQAMIKPAKTTKKIAQAIFKEIECFANVKFVKKDILNIPFNDEFELAICDTTPKFLTANLNTIAHMFLSASAEGWASAELPYTGALVLIDSINQGLGSYGVNSVLHELLHVLGLGHPSYSSLEEQIKYRSIVQNDSYDNLTPLGQACKDTGYTGTELRECFNLPTKLTPVDIKGLITVLGESDDNTKYCKNIRSEFYNEYSDYFELEPAGDNQHNSEEL